VAAAAPDGLIRRRRLIAGVALALAVLAIVAGVVVATSGGSGPAIANRAATLVPSDALVYVHLSTDTDRAAVKDAQELGDTFPSYARLRDRVLGSLAISGDVRPWLGDELALALTGGSGGTAGSLVLLAVGDQAKAKAFIAQGARKSGPGKTYKGVRLNRYGAVYAALIGDFVALGQADTLEQAIDLHQGHGTALSADPTYRKTTTGLPADRVADAYATSDGLGRLLVPAGGALGIAGVLFDRPGLKGVAASLGATSPGAEIVVRSDVPDREAKEFTPSLLDAVPKSAMAYYGTRGLDQNITRLLSAAGTQSLADLLEQVTSSLGSSGVRAVRKDLLSLLGNESAVALLPSVPAPIALIIARAEDADATRAALQRLSQTLPRVLKGAKVSERDGVTTVKSDQAEFDLAVIDDKLVASTSMKGIEAARDPDGGIADNEHFRATVESTENPVTSVVFLDFSQLLTLAEQTGLNDSRSYLAVRNDLRKLQAVGVRSTGAGEDTTSEIRFQIP
jgi:hypothetical protein